MDIGLNIAIQTTRDYLKTTVALSLIFVAMAIMFIGIYPSFKVNMEELMENLPDYPIRGFDMATSYMGFLNIELYQIFWVLILAILLGYIAGTVVSKEIESKTMDMLLSNPIPRYRIVLEKFLGLVPTVLTVNLVTMAVVMVLTPVIGEEPAFYDLFLTHIMSIPYFLTVLAIGILVSTVIDEKMKASIVVMAIVIGSYLMLTIGFLAPDYEKIKLISIANYYNPEDILLKGNLDVIGSLILVIATVGLLLAAIWYFDRRDIKI